jgi:titin
VAPRTGTTGLTRTANVTVPTGGVTFYRVLALNLTAGITTYSVPTASVSLDTVLAAPGAPTAAIVSTTRITLSWLDNSTNETSFQVFRSADGGATFAQACTATRSAAQGAATGGALVTCNDNGVVLGNTYQYYVVAANSGVTSIPSGTIEVPFALPTAPAPLVATAVRVVGSNTRSNVTLTWGALPVGATVTVQRITPAGGGTNTLLTNSTATGFVDNNLRRNALDYIYQIRINVAPLSSAYVQTSVLVN